MNTPINQSVYVGRVSVTAGKLMSDRLLEFSFLAFNGTGLPLRLLPPIQGRVAYGGPPAALPRPGTTLPTPAIREDNPTEFPSYGEFMVIIEQRVPGDIAAEMDRFLPTGRPIQFDLTRLDIHLQREGKDQVERLPLWDRINCFQVMSTELGPMLHVGRIHTATVNATIGASG